MTPTDTRDALTQRVEQASSTLRETIDGAATGAHQTVDKLAHTLTRGASTVGNQVQRMVYAPSELVNASRGVIQTHPLRAVGMSLAVGWVVGRLSARR